jgi:hypothetical protein
MAGESALPPFSAPARECQGRTVFWACKHPGEAATSRGLAHTGYSDPVQVRRVYKFRAYPKPGYSRFKPRSPFDQVMFVSGDSAKWVPAGKDGWASACLQAVGSVKVKQHWPTGKAEEAAGESWS